VVVEAQSIKLKSYEIVQDLSKTFVGIPPMSV